MGLAQFINENIDPILVEWEAFAKSLPPGQTMTSTAFRDDAERMLRFVAADMEASQSEAQRSVKGRGRQVVGSDDTAAQAHGRLRLTQAFDLVQMVSEFVRFALASFGCGPLSRGRPYRLRRQS